MATLKYHPLWTYFTFTAMVGFWVKGVAVAQGFWWTLAACVFPPVGWVLALAEFYYHAGT